ncbi:MAG: glutathione peroxidase [Bacteroidales bacterium]
MKTLLTIIFSGLILSWATGQEAKTIHDFTVKTIDGNDISLSEFKGKKILIVNTASKCGLTPQYEELQELYTRYGDDDFVIIGFPANNFLKQEPGSDEEIREFCKVNYGVTFPMMGKISVKGKNIHPIYEWLTQKEHNGVLDTKVKWNFQKFLVDENGNLVDVVYPRTSPMSEAVISWIEGS